MNPLSATKRRVKIGLVCLALTMGSGCTVGALLNDSGSFFSDQEVNLIQTNYAAADFLVGQARNNINRTTPIYYVPLRPVYSPQSVSAFGRLMTEQVAARIAQLGYTVKAFPKDTGLAAVDLPRRYVVLGGNYLRSGGDATINLRMTASETEQIIASYDYNVPLNNEIDELMALEPVTIRTTGTAAEPLPLGQRQLPRY